MGEKFLTPDQTRHVDAVKQAVDNALEEVPSAVLLSAICVIAGRVSALAQFDGHPRPVLKDLIRGNLSTGEDQGRRIVTDHLKGRTN